MQSELVPPELYVFLGQGLQPSSESANCPSAQATNSVGFFVFYISFKEQGTHTPCNIIILIDHMRAVNVISVNVISK